MSERKGGATVKVLLVILCLILGVVAFGILRVSNITDWPNTRVGLSFTPSGIAGRYIAACILNGATVKRVIELKPDGRFLYWRNETDSTGISGRYDLSGENDISFSFDGEISKGSVTKAQFVADYEVQNSLIARDASGHSRNLMRNCILTRDSVFGNSTDRTGIPYLRE